MLHRIGHISRLGYLKAKSILTSPPPAQEVVSVLLTQLGDFMTAENGDRLVIA